MMKPGCILKVIFGIFISIGIISYIVKTHGPRIKETAEIKAKEIIREKVDSEIKSVKDNLLKAELEEILSTYFDEVKDSTYESIKNSGDSLLNFLAGAMKDSVIDLNEIESLKNLIKNE